MLNAPPVLQSAEEDELFAKISRRLLPFLFLLYVVSYLDRVNVSFAGASMRADLAARGLNEQVFGAAGGIFFLGYFLFEVPSNLILQRVGARKWIARIMLSWGIVATAMALVRGPKSFYGMRFVLGLAEAGFFPGMILYLTFWYPAARRGRAVAIFMTATAISGVIGALISTAILRLDGISGLHGWQWLFILEGLPAIILSAVVFWILPDGPGNAHWLTQRDRELLADLFSRERAGSSHHVGDLLKAVVHPRLWLLTSVYFCIALGMYCVTIWLPDLLAAAWTGQAKWHYTLLSAIPYAVAAIGMVLVGRNSDRTGDRRWHTVISLVVATAGAIGSASLHQPAMTLIAFSLIALGIWSAIGPFWAMPPAFLAGTAAAGGIALINSVGNLGSFLGPTIVGFVKQRTGSFTIALWILAGFLALGAVLASFIRVTRPQELHSAPQ